MKYLLLSFDLEEFDVPRDYGLDIPEGTMYDVSGRGLEVILALLADVGGVGATFFTTTNFARKFPKMMTRIARLGHEVGLHGLSHGDNYAAGSRDDVLVRLSRAKRDLERIIGREVSGFRAPRLFAPSPEVLSRIGLDYDSSLHPTFIPGRYNHFFKSRAPRTYGPLLEIPISVAPLARLPFTWMFFRNLPLAYSRLCTRASVPGTGYINIYFHPWEFVDLRGFGDLPGYMTRRTGRPLADKLKAYLRWTKSKKFICLTMSEYIRAAFPDRGRSHRNDGAVGRRPAGRPARHL